MHSSETRLQILRPPPRRVGLRPGALGPILIPQLVTLFLLAVGLFVLLTILEGPIILAFGSDVDVYVRSVGPSGGRDRNPNIRQINFSYDVGNGIRKTGSGRIDTAGGPVPKLGQKLPARTLKFDPLGRIILKRQIINVESIVIFGLFSLVFCIFSSLAGVIVSISARLDRRLVRDGLAAPGTITAKESDVVRGNHARRRIEFSFQALDGTTHTGKRTVTFDHFESLHQGQAITILYRPECPQYASVYETSRYRAID
jgi:hypothetical protein